MTTKKVSQGGPVTLAFSYRRYSSLNQSDTSLERQGKDNLKICAEHGWSLVDLPPDRAVSAWHGNWGRWIKDRCSISQDWPQPWITVSGTRPLW